MLKLTEMTLLCIAFDVKFPHSSVLPTLVSTRQRILLFLEINIKMNGEKLTKTLVDVMLFLDMV